MSKERNIKWLNDRRIVYRQFPINDVPTIETNKYRSSRVDSEAIYQCMLDINELGKHICIGRIAGLLDVSSRTIYRHINDELKQEIKILNEEI